MASLLDISITGTPSLSIAERRLQYRNSQIQGTYPDDSLSIPRSIVLPSFECRVEQAASPPFMTPLSYWSPDTTLMSLPASTYAVSSTSSSRRSSFSDILDDDDYSSASNVDIFQARRETVQRAQPRKLRWEAGSLRAAYAKMQAEYEDSSSSSSDGGKSVDGEENEKVQGSSRLALDSPSSVAVMEHSESSKTSFFHHNTLRRHNSTGNYTRAQLSKKDLAAGLALKGTAIAEQQSSSASPQRRNASRRTRRTHRKQIVISSRESSLDKQWKMHQTSEGVGLTRKLSMSLSDDSTMPPTPPDSQPSSPRPYEEAGETNKESLLFQPIDAHPPKTTSFSGHVKTLSKSSSFSLTDKLFSGIKLLR